MRPPYPSRRSVSNAASAAAPPPRMTIDAGVPAEGSRAARDGNAWRPRTKCLPSDGFNRPAGDRVQRRSTYRLAGPQAEAGMMPGTAHRVADQQPFRERAAVVRTGCADRKHLAAGSGQDHRILPNVAEQHGAIGEQRGIDTLGEIGASRLCLVCVHGVPQTADNRISICSQERGTVGSIHASDARSGRPHVVPARHCCTNT